MIKTKKHVIYSAQFGAYDEIRKPKNIFKNVDYILFSDTSIEVPEPWINITIPVFTIDSIYPGRRMSRYCKALPHLLMRGWETCIWIDMTHEVVEEPSQIFDLYMKNHDVCSFKHENRWCVYDEMNAVYQWKMDHSVNLKRQASFYRTSLYPENNGLYETSALIRKNNIKTQTMNSRWWELMCRYSSRDQISLPFVLWSLNMKIDLLPGHAGKNKINNDVIPFIKGHNHEIRVDNH